MWILMLEFSIILTYCCSQTTDNQVRIGEGTSCDINDYPYYVHLLLKKTNTKISACGGSILGRDAVLTAAHCCRGSRKIYMYSGARNEEGISEQEDVSRRYIIHPQYEDVSNVYDLCVVKLLKGFELTEKIQFVNLTDTQTFAQVIEGNRLVQVMGYGLNKYSYEKEKWIVDHSKPLQCTGAISSKLFDCYVHISGYMTTETFDPKSMFCTTPNATQGFACQGDSGGPAMFNGVQVGVVSWALGVCDRRMTVFGRIDSETDFIVNAINRSQSNQCDILMFVGLYFVMFVVNTFS